MIDKKIETTAEEVIGFLRAAGLEIEIDPTAKCFQLELADGSIIEMPPDFNIFEDMSPFTSVKSCPYNSSSAENKDGSYVSGGIKHNYDKCAVPFVNAA